MKIMHGYFQPVAIPATADSIVLVNVLEHIAEDQAFLDDVYAALTPGGALLLLVPAVMGQSLAGLWDCTVTVNGQEIPFRMEFAGKPPGSPNACQRPPSRKYSISVRVARTRRPSGI